MIDSPLVTCIVPTFNSARSVRHALESIFAQTHRPLQVVVADDGSTDDTLGIVRSVSRAIDITAHATAGPAAARNRGLRAACGDLVAFLDADKEWHPEKLARQVVRFGARPNLEVCLSHMQMVWSEEHATEQAGVHERRCAATVPGYATTTMLARRTLFDLIGAVDRDLCFVDATDWLLRATQRGICVEMLADVLTYHRVQGSSNLTAAQSDACHVEFLHLIKRTLDRQRGRGPDSRIEAS